MPSLLQSSFIGGEWAPEYYGRVDHPLYKHGLRRARNFIVLPQGGARFRSGTRFAAAPKNGAAAPVRLYHLRPQPNRVYVFEFGAHYIRFFRNKAPVLSAGAPFEIDNTPYATADLAGLGFTAYQNQLYIWHPNYQTRILSWGGGADTNWSLSLFATTDGPYLDPQSNGNSATPNAAAGAATVNFASTAGINNGAGLSDADVGRWARFQCPLWTLTSGSINAAGAAYNVGDAVYPAGGTPMQADSVTGTAVLTISKVSGTGAVEGVAISSGGQYLIPPPSPNTPTTNSGGSGLTGNLGFSQNGPPIWLNGTITTVHSPTSCDVTLRPLITDAIGTTIPGTFLSTAAIATWRLGAWCPFEGFPSCGGLFQSRLATGGTEGGPKRGRASSSGGVSRFGNFAPSLATGQAIDSNALDFDFDDDESDPIAWITGAGSAQIPQLGIGSGDGEFVLEGAGGGVLTPTSVQTYRETRYGAAPVPPVRIGKFLLYVDKSLRRLRQWFYQYFAGGYVGPEAAPMGKHLLLSGIQQLDYALTPDPVLWANSFDGQFAGLTFVTDEKDQNNTVQAWHSHQLGGNHYGGPPSLDSLCVAPSEDGSYDQLWIAALRTLPDGTPIRTIEVQDMPFRAPTRLTASLPLDQACFLDCAVSSALAFPNATATPALGPFQPSGNPLLPQRGDSVAFTFSAAVAQAADPTPGTVLRINGGTFRVASYQNPESVVCECLDPPAKLLPQTVGNWSYTPMKTSFTGFAALAGFVVTALADGQPYAGIAVTGDTLTLPAGALPASYVTAGLPYQGELETLDLDLPALDGTGQMKEGYLDHLYLRLFDTLGGRFGTDAARLDPVPIEDDLAGWAPPLFAGDLRIALDAGHSRSRRVIIRQDQPWPMTVTALVVKGGTTEIEPK